jgi:hypothetical protein
LRKQSLSSTDFRAEDNRTLQLSIQANPVAPPDQLS